MLRNRLLKQQGFPLGGRERLLRRLRSKASPLRLFVGTFGWLRLHACRESETRHAEKCPRLGGPLPQQNDGRSPRPSYCEKSDPVFATTLAQ